MRKPPWKIRQRSVEWFHRDFPTISSSLHMSRTCFSSAGALHAFPFFTWISIRHFPLCKCKQNSFSHHCNARLSAVKVWNIIENRACAAVVHGFSKKPWTTFECIYTNTSDTFTSKVNSGLDKPIPKPFRQDKPRLELALGWISREHRFFTIYTATVSRGLFSLV